MLLLLFADLDSPALRAIAVIALVCAGMVLLWLSGKRRSGSIKKFAASREHEFQQQPNPQELQLHQDFIRRWDQLSNVMHGALDGTPFTYFEQSGNRLGMFGVGMGVRRVKTFAQSVVCFEIKADDEFNFTAHNNQPFLARRAGTRVYIWRENFVARASKIGNFLSDALQFLRDRRQ